MVVIALPPVGWWWWWWRCCCCYRVLQWFPDFSSLQSHKFLLWSDEDSLVDTVPDLQHLFGSRSPALTHQHNGTLGETICYRPSAHVLSHPHLHTPHLHTPPLLLPKSICWSPNIQCVGIWKWNLWEVIPFRLGHEDGVHDGILTFIRRGRHQSPSLPCEETARGGHPHWGRGFLPDTKSTGILILDFPTFSSEWEKYIFIV